MSTDPPPTSGRPEDAAGFAPGTVWLVGAGPGDPGLLTLHAARALAEADAVVYDALVDRRILDRVRSGAVVEFAGKRGGRPSPSQPDISRRLVELARAGHRVLRLKGGDPFVFGRGGEEALALAEAGIPFRVVPGVTAGIGGPAYAGIPVTHRGIAQSVTFLTGHDPDGAVPDDLDWSALARLPVLVIYMGLRHIGEIADRLTRHGRPGGEAVALIARATTPEQRLVLTTLKEAAEAAKDPGLETPVLVVVGKVVRLHDTLMPWINRRTPSGAIPGN